jgi:hypothetical protein
MAFVSGQKVTAAQLNSAAPTGAVQSTQNSTGGTTTSATYTDTLSGTTTHTLGFTVPASGAIWVTIKAALDNSAANYTQASYRISGSAGTVAASDNWNIFSQGTSEITISRRTMQTGLTPGATGTITMQYNTSGGTATVNHRQILVDPVPA